MGKRKTASTELLDKVADATDRQDDAVIGDNSDTAAEDDLYAIVKRIFSLEHEIKFKNDAKAVVFAEAKAKGHDMTVLRGVIADLRIDKATLTKKQAARVEQQQLATTYHEAIARAARRAGEDLGMLVATRAGARARGDE